MDEKKRIIEFDAAESVPVDGQMAIDSPQLGTKKITPTLLLKDINDLLGDVPLQTQAQILTGAINELNAKIFQASIKTQAEWEALPDTKFSDNIAYYIRDGESTVGNALWTKVGLHGLDTNAKNCSDAINELKGTLVGKATVIDVGTISGSDSKTTIINVFNAINVFDTPVLVKFYNLGQGIGLAYKYSGGDHGMMVCMRYGFPNVFTLSRISNTDTVSYFTGTSY